ncbi:MAG: bifunctional DNA-formamidopyrimidine glycosylase/DNA-(apurinic or apyrimidinic site) lyase [Candidatus Aminicenantales bacterium]|jgi:formamidopyrimidine-DNA glycosylase
MPELPEVESIAAGLRRTIRGLIISSIDLRREALLRRGRPADLDPLVRRTITDVRRRGKHLIIAAGGRALIFHLKMTGGFQWADPASPVDKHTHLIFRFRRTRRELRFHDVRKFGFVLCLPAAGLESCPELSALGPEPLEIGFDEFYTRLRTRRGRLKSVLLDQSFVAGIGNIYADEMLFESGIRPLASAAGLSRARADRLWTAMRAVLAKAVAAGGSTIRSYRNAEGEIGHFQDDHQVYGRTGEPCLRCGGPVRRRTIGGRSSHFCPRCQR